MPPSAKTELHAVDPETKPKSLADTMIRQDGGTTTVVAVEHQEFPSVHARPDQKPVVAYLSERERQHMDAEYKVTVTDLKLGSDKDKLGGVGSVTVNGLHRSFPLNVPVTLYGFQIRALKNCTYAQPEVKWDEDAGQLKQTGRLLEVSRFRIERKDDEFGI